MKKAIFKMLPPFGMEKESDISKSNAKKRDIENRTTSSNFLKSFFSLPFFGNTGFYLKTYFKPQVRMNKKVPTEEMMEIERGMGKYKKYTRKDIPHPKFFHRRIIGH